MSEELKQYNNGLVWVIVCQSLAVLEPTVISNNKNLVYEKHDQSQS